MRTYIDSADQVSDPPSLRGRMKARGSLFISNLLPVERLIRLREAAANILEKAGWLDTRFPPQNLVARPGVFFVEPNPGYRAVWYDLYSMEELHSLAHHENIYRLFTALLDGRPIHHPRVMIRAIFPRSASSQDFSTPAHQDYPVIQGARETYTLWIPLADCPTDMGPLVVADQSHERGIFDTRSALGAGGTEVIEDLTDFWTTGPFRCGDVAIFHSHTVHKALPNLTNTIRLSVDIRYQRIDEPMNRFSVEYGDNHPLSWPLVYSSWKKTDHQYFWQPHSLNLVDFDWTYFRKRDEEALEKASQGDRSTISVLQRIVANDSDEAKRQRARELLAKFQ